MRSLELPYELPVANGIDVGWCLTVRGAIAEDPNNFVINLLTGDGGIALHLNPRFNDGDSGRVVVLNSLLAESWGSEQRPEAFPFAPCEPFEVRLRCEEDAFSVEVNDVVPLCSFAHRAAASSIAAVYINGDIALSDVEIA